MSATRAPEAPVENWEAIRDEWVAAVEALITDAESWCATRGWRSERQAKPVYERGIGSYEAPQLWFNPGRGRTLLLDVTARFVPGAAGVADLYRWPEFDGVMILRTEHGWHLHLPVERSEAKLLPWSEQAFGKAAEWLIQHEPS